MTKKDQGFSWDNKLLEPLYLEQIKTLRSKVIHLSEAADEKIIGISSTTAEEGKTSIAINLASSIAAVQDKKVIILDGDLRKSDLTVNLGLYGREGLSEFLEGKNPSIKSIINNSRVPNLYILTSGKRTRSPSELLAKKAFKNLLQFLRREFDIVLIDLPPIIGTADPITVREVIDRFIYVYYAGKTNIKLLERAINELGKDKICGVILNAVTTQDIKKYRTYYYYG